MHIIMRKGVENSMEKYCRNYIAVAILDIVEKIKIRTRQRKG